MEASHNRRGKRSRGGYAGKPRIPGAVSQPQFGQKWLADFTDDKENITMKKMAKRLASLLMAFVLVLSLGATAFAAGVDAAEDVCCGHEHEEICPASLNGDTPCAHTFVCHEDVTYSYGSPTVCNRTTTRICTCTKCLHREVTGLGTVRTSHSLVPHGTNTYRCQQCGWTTAYNPYNP